MGWLPEHDEALKVCFAGGMSCNDAAASLNCQFGTTFSRNAVIGRALRQKIQTAKPAHGGPSQNARRHKPASKKTFFPKVAAEPKPERKIRPAPVQFACEPVTGLRVADVVPLHLSLLDLAPGQCRWPYGDGPFTFCGCHTFDGSSYCEPHAALAQGPGSRGEQMAHHVTKSVRAA